MAGDVTVIATMEPKNDAFPVIVHGEHIGMDNLSEKSNPIAADKLLLADSEVGGGTDADLNKKWVSISSIGGGAMNFQAKTTDYNLTDADMGVTWTNEGALALVTFNLPAITSINMNYRFYIEDEVGIAINSPSATVQILNYVGSAITESTRPGSSLWLAAYDVDKWCALSIFGTWNLSNEFLADEDGRLELSEEGFTVPSE